MRSTETMDMRLKRVDMHDYFLRRINASMTNKNYIEASWLIYSCFENRYYRIIEKVRDSCRYCRSKSKCNKTKKNDLALATKIKCVQRLRKAGVSCIATAFRNEIFQETLNWVDERNILMHDLLSLEFYESSDDRFKASAEIGVMLLNETYKSCTEFRRLFYDDGYQFNFPEEAMEGCPCKPRKAAN